MNHLLPCRLRWRWVSALVLCLAGVIAAQAADPLPQWEDGRALYFEGEYERAADAFREAVTIDPSRSTHHHWLGKAYGRLAERAGWFRALRLARKTRAAFETAVELDPDNAEAVEDLADFHAQAPAIVGGNPARAEALREHLEQLREASEGA